MQSTRKKYDNHEVFSFYGWSLESKECNRIRDRELLFQRKFYNDSEYTFVNCVVSSDISDLMPSLVYIRSDFTDFSNLMMNCDDNNV